MKTLIVVATVFFLQMSQANAEDRSATLWDSLLRASPGVYVAKLRHADGVQYVFFSAGDRVRPTSTLLPAEVGFMSIEEASKFARAKPQKAVLMDGNTPELVDDAGILLRFTDEEKAELCLVDWRQKIEGRGPND